MMKEHPIRFNPAIVQALFEGRKTQMRRPVLSDECPYGKVGDILSVVALDKIELEITDIKKQRVDLITDGEALAEGVEKVPGGYRDYTEKRQFYVSPRRSFLSLWRSIYNNDVPYLVWVIHFRLRAIKIKKNK